VASVHQNDCRHASPDATYRAASCIGALAPSEQSTSRQLAPASVSIDAADTYTTHRPYLSQPASTLRQVSQIISILSVITDNILLFVVIYVKSSVKSKTGMILAVRG